MTYFDLNPTAKNLKLKAPHCFALCSDSTWFRNETQVGIIFRSVT